MIRSLSGMPMLSYANSAITGPPIFASYENPGPSTSGMSSAVKGPRRKTGKKSQGRASGKPHGATKKQSSSSSVSMPEKYARPDDNGSEPKTH